MLTMATLQRLWKASRPLTVAGILMTAALIASLIAMAVDPSRILGAPRWLKPSKFHISSAIYAFTLAWIFTYLPDRPKLTSRVGWITAAVLVIEVAIIDVQAARGITSHFNAGTVLDGLLFSIMGAAILVLWCSAIALTVALFRQPFADSALGWALRLGMLITVIGQGTGAFMTVPTRTQLEAARSTGLKVSGAHTVGAPDGGPGLPLTGWSREHGDLRVPHFLGMHAVQLLPAFAWLLTPIASIAVRRRAVFAAAAGYVVLFAVLLAQALNGHPLIPLMVSR